MLSYFLTICNHVHVHYMASSIRLSVVYNVRVPYSHCDMSCDEPVMLFRRMRESVIDTFEHVCFP